MLIQCMMLNQCGFNVVSMYDVGSMWVQCCFSDVYLPVCAYSLKYESFNIIDIVSQTSNETP